MITRTDTLYEIFSGQVQRDPRRPFIWFLGKWISNGKLFEWTQRLGKYFASYGVTKGTIVAVYLPNTPQYFVTLLACYRLGATVAPINPTYRRAEIFHFLDSVQARVLVTLDVFYEANALQDGRDYVDQILVTNLTDLVGGVRVTHGKELYEKHPKIQYSSGVYSFREIISRKTKKRLPPFDLSTSDKARIIEVQVDAPRSKFVTLTHHNMCFQARHLHGAVKSYIEREGGQNLPLGTGTIGIFPVYHLHGTLSQIYLPVLLEAFILLYHFPPPSRRLLRDLVTLRQPAPLVFPAVQPLLHHYLKYITPDRVSEEIQARLLLTYTTGDGFDDTTCDAFEAVTKSPVHQFVGFTEVAPYMLARDSGQLCQGEQDPQRARPLPEVRLEVFDARQFASGPLSPGKENELFLACQHHVHEFHAEADQDPTYIHTWGKQVWLSTHLRACKTEQGSFRLLGRQFSPPLAGKYPVFPQHVVALSGFNPNIEEAQAGLVYSEKEGEESELSVKLSPRASSHGEVAPPSERELRKWWKQNLSKHKVPKHLKLNE